MGWPSRASCPRRPRSPRSRPSCSGGSSGPRRSSRSAVRGAGRAGRRSPPVWRTSVSRSSASSRPASTPGARRRTSRRPPAEFRLFVKTLGDDERSADRLFRLYRRVVPRDLGDERPFSSLRRAVEHEALLALTARDVGVRTPHLVALARAKPKGFTLAYEAIERSLARPAGPRRGDRRGAGRASGTRWRCCGPTASPTGTCGLANVFLAEDGQVWLIDFGFSEMAVGGSCCWPTDVAELRGVVGACRSERAGRWPGRSRRWTARRSGRRRTGCSRGPSAAPPATALRERAGLLDDVRARIGAAV